MDIVILQTSGVQKQTPIQWLLLCDFFVVFFTLSIWTGQLLRRPAVSIRPVSRGSAAYEWKPSCSESSVCQGTSSAVTVARPTLAGPQSTWASCSASNAPASTGRVQEKKAFSFFQIHLQNHAGRILADERFETCSSLLCSFKVLVLNYDLHTAHTWRTFWDLSPKSLDLWFSVRTLVHIEAAVRSSCAVRKKH